MFKLSTMQKLFGLSLILSLFTVAVGMYSVSNLSKLSDDIETLFKIHVKGLDAVLHKLIAEMKAQGEAA